MYQVIYVIYVHTDIENTQVITTALSMMHKTPCNAAYNQRPDLVKKTNTLARLACPLAAPFQNTTNFIMMVEQAPSSRLEVCAE